MPYDPSYPANGIKIRAVDFRNQFAAIKTLIDDQAATIAAQAAEIAALQVPVPTAAQISGLSYNGSAMEVTFAPTDGENASELTVLWWPEGGAVTRVALTLPTQSVPVGSAAGVTFWQTEVKNASGATVLSGGVVVFSELRGRRGGWVRVDRINPAPRSPPNSPSLPKRESTSPPPPKSSPSSSNAASTPTY